MYGEPARLSTKVLEMGALARKRTVQTMPGVLRLPLMSVPGRKWSLFRRILDCTSSARDAVPAARGDAAAGCGSDAGDVASDAKKVGVVSITEQYCSQVV
jgi:hypothetical protein